MFFTHKKKIRPIRIENDSFDFFPCEKNDTFNQKSQEVYEFRAKIPAFYRPLQLAEYRFKSASQTFNEKNLSPRVFLVKK